jgi:hypothetical protein
MNYKKLKEFDLLSIKSQEQANDWKIKVLESGEEFYKEMNADVVSDEPDKIKALISIHARACRITDEILCLLKGGFPDAAFARW